MRIRSLAGDAKSACVMLPTSVGFVIFESVASTNFGRTSGMRSSSCSFVTLASTASSTRSCSTKCTIAPAKGSNSSDSGSSQSSRIICSLTFEFAHEMISTSSSTRFSLEASSFMSMAGCSSVRCLGAGTDSCLVFSSSEQEGEQGKTSGSLRERGTCSANLAWLLLGIHVWISSSSSSTN